ncbi:MAG: hypothetical protein ACK5KO_05185 [Arachnia sp.]
MSASWLADADRHAHWPAATVVVAGLGVSGFAAADGLMSVGARTIVLDESPAPAAQAALLEQLDVTVRLGPGVADELPAEADLLIASPGWSPSAPLLRQALDRGIPVWGEPELAWRLMQPDREVPWLGIAGDGARGATLALGAILQAAGLKSTLVGATGRPVMEAVLDEDSYDAVVVELSDRQLRWLPTVAFHSAAVLAAGTTAESRVRRARSYAGVRHSAIYNVEDSVTEDMVVAAEVTDGARAIGITTGIPGMSMVGIVDDLIVDRAFIEQRRHSAMELLPVRDVAGHEVPQALLAAALARSFGVPARAVAAGLRAVEPNA